MIRLALPNKGRLANATLELLDEAGLGAPRAERSLSSMIGEGIQAIFVRAWDIPEFVADGATDAGVTEWDIVLESTRPIKSALDLGFGECRLVVAAREESEINSVDDVPSATRIATAFPRLAADFFARAYKSVEIVPGSGATESGSHLYRLDSPWERTSRDRDGPKRLPRDWSCEIPTCQPPARSRTSGSHSNRSSARAGCAI